MRLRAVLFIATIALGRIASAQTQTINGIPNQSMSPLPVAAYAMGGTPMNNFRCAYGSVLTSTSGTATVSYAGMGFTTLYFIAAQSVATGNTAATANSANVSSPTATGANISVTTPATISVLGALTVQLASAVTTVYVVACGV